MHENPVYSVVIPAFEEEKFIAGTLNSLHRYLKSFPGFWDKTEVIVVSANGKDETAELAGGQSKLFKSFKVIEPGPKKGKGRDVRVGMRAATGDYRLFMDADLATPLRHLKPAFEVLEQGSDIVIGERDLFTVHNQFKRRLVSIAGNRLIQLILGLRYGDSQCGFKGFTAKSSDIIFGLQTIDGWGFDIELLAIAREHKMSVSRLEIPDWHDPKTDVAALVGESTWQASARTFKELRKIRKQWKKGMYR